MQGGPFMICAFSSLSRSAQTIKAFLFRRAARAIQNKLCVLSQDFFQKEGASEAKKTHTHNE